MAKILMGISGFGNGHATKCGVIIQHLLANKHELVICSYGQGYAYLSPRFRNVVKVDGPVICYKNNRISNLETLRNFMSQLPRIAKNNISAYMRIAKEFRPDIIISDMDPIIPHVARALKRPLVTVEYNSIISYTRYRVPKELILSYIKNTVITDILVTKADYKLIPTFFFTRPRSRNVFLEYIPLRKEILSIRPKNGNFIFVYQTTKTNANLLKVLRKTPEQFVIYGYDKDMRSGNLIFRKFNDTDFYRDLGNCKAIIANGGMGLISEAISLKKPIFTEPLVGQFEQEIASLYVGRYKYGMYVKRISVANLSRFLSELDTYRKVLEEREPWDNSGFMRKLDEIILLCLAKSRKKALFHKRQGTDLDQ